MKIFLKIRNPGRLFLSFVLCLAALIGQPVFAAELPLDEEPLQTELVLAEQEAAEAGLSYEGFLVEVTDKAVSSHGQEAACFTEAVEHTDNLFFAESAEEIFADFDSSEIVSIEPNTLVELLESTSVTEPDDEYYVKGYQDYLPYMKTEAVWSNGLDGTPVSGGDAVVVALIDTGVNYDHEDIDADHILPGKRWQADDPEDIKDWQGHGTLCAGQIMATRNNGIGIAGIVPEIKILPLSIFYKDDAGKTTAQIKDLVSAINYAAEAGADVINMSLGDKSDSAALKKACENAIQSGCLLIAAAGNDGTDTVVYPAAYETVVGVGSVGTKNDPLEISTFSQHGLDNVFCTACGYRVYGPGYKSSSSYVTNSGTSFASPEVTALAALAKSIDRDMNQEEFMQLLADTCQDLGETGRDELYGYGLISFEAVINKLANVSLSLDQSSLLLPTKKTVQLQAQVKSSIPVNRTVKWESSDESIATVDQKGVVKTLRYGTATITASLEAGSDLTASCNVQTRFYDVFSESLYYFTPVYWAAEKGITGGIDNVYFGAADSCTRKQMMIFLWKMAGSPKQGGKMIFPDVSYSKNSASYQAILWGCSTGIIKGYQDGKFHPDDCVTRKQAMIMLYRYAGNPASRGKMKFSDIHASVNSATYKAILWGCRNKITNGYADKKFHPSDPCLRKHIVTFLYRYAFMP